MIDSNTGWAPVVHGRTFRVDFRPHLLVVPEWFTDEDISIARRFVQASMRTAEQLPQGERWLMVKTGRFQLVGVTCMAEAVSAEMIHDHSGHGSGGTGRPLHVFLGWATGDLAADPPPMELEIYQPLYEFVRSRWDDDPYDPRAQECVAAPAMDQRFPAPPGDPPIEGFTPEPDSPGSPNPTLRIWPDSQRVALWAAAARYPGRVSLCIGMARSRDAEDSPLGNITVAGADEPTTLNREPEVTVATSARQDTGAGDHAGEHVSEVPPRPRRRFVARNLWKYILEVFEAVLRRLGFLGGQTLKALPAPAAPTAPTVGMDDIVRPVDRTTGRPKADVFDAFDDPPLAVGKASPPPPTQEPSDGPPPGQEPSNGPPPGQKPSNDDRLDEISRRNMGRKDTGTCP